LPSGKTDIRGKYLDIIQCDWLGNHSGIVAIHNRVRKFLKQSRQKSFTTSALTAKENKLLTVEIKRVEDFLHGLLGIESP
jgi:hypothetical protein